MTLLDRKPSNILTITVPSHRQMSLLYQYLFAIDGLCIDTVVTDVHQTASCMSHCSTHHTSSHIRLIAKSDVHNNAHNANYGPKIKREFIAYNNNKTISAKSNDLRYAPQSTFFSVFHNRNNPQLSSVSKHRRS